MPRHITDRQILLGPLGSFFGDSITWYGEGYPYWAAIQSGGAFRAEHVKSNSGWSSTGLLGAIDAQIIQASPRPSWCMILCGANDASASTPLATYRANVIEMVRRLRAAGIAPVLSSVAPNNVDSIDAFIRLYNVWLTRYCEEEQIPLVDFYSLVVNQATGDWKAGWDNGDGLHPTNLANKAMGKAVVDALKPLMVPRPYVVQPFSGSPNIQLNSNFLTDTNVDGLADSLSGPATDGSLAYSRVDDARGFKWQRMTLTGGVTGKQIQGNSASVSGGGISVGDRMRFSARVRTGQDGGQTRLQVTCYKTAYSAVTLNRIVTAPVPDGMTRLIEDGVAVSEFVIPAETEIVLWTYYCGPVAGTYDVAQPTLYNLTKLGAV